jgi:ribosomal-protein-alanine N-acetyltransferase
VREEDRGHFAVINADPRVMEHFPAPLDRAESDAMVDRMIGFVGLATEAARAATDDRFDRVGLREIVSFTTAANERSQAVMRRLGMTHDPAEDFAHPSLVAADPLSQHVLYRQPRPLRRARAGAKTGRPVWET